MKQKWLMLVLVLLGLTLFLSGCGSKEIFINKDEKYKLVQLSDKEIEKDVFYAKEGAGFYATYMPKGTVTNKAKESDPSRVLWLQKDNTLVPSIYQDGSITYASIKNQIFDSALIERFKDMGMTFGIQGGSLDDDGAYVFKAKESVVKDSSAADVFLSKKKQAETIKIVTIDDKPVADYVEDGLFVGLKENKSYSVGYYSGTYYETAQIDTDTHMLQSYEVYEDDDIDNTKNGYISVNMPSGAKSGYYLINGEGLFKYYAYEKGAQDDNKTDMNEKYYKSEIDGKSTDTQIYTVSVKELSFNVSFTLTYDDSATTADQIKCMLQAPDGTQYEMAASDGTCYAQVPEVMAGKWSIYFSPANIKIKDVNVDASSQNANSQKETYEFDVPEDSANMQFYVVYSGDGDIWGTVQSADTGESTQLEDITKDSKNKTTTIGANCDYLAAGHYTMTVYHYSDTTIIDHGLQVDSSKVSEDILEFEQ